MEKIANAYIIIFALHDFIQNIDLVIWKYLSGKKSSYKFAFFQFRFCE